MSHLKILIHNGTKGAVGHHILYSDLYRQMIVAPDLKIEDISSYSHLTAAMTLSAKDYGMLYTMLEAC